MRRAILGTLFIAIVVAARATPAPAQTLADRVPDDAIIYVGWRGTTDPGQAYQGSHLQTFVQASQFQATIQQVLPQLLQRFAAKDAESAAAARQVLPIVERLW